MNAPMEPMLSMFQANIDVCRQMAEIIINGTERMEQASLKALRGGLRQGFGAASALSSGADAANSFKPVPLDELLSSNREMVETVFKTSAELTRTMTEYCANCSKSVVQTVDEVSRPAGGIAPTQQLESIMKLWNRAYQQMGEFAQQVAQVSGSTFSKEPAGTKAVRHQ